MIDDLCINNLAKIEICNIFIQIRNVFYGDAMLCPWKGQQHVIKTKRYFSKALYNKYSV